MWWTLLPACTDYDLRAMRLDGVDAPRDTADVAVVPNPDPEVVPPEGSVAIVLTAGFTTVPQRCEGIPVAEREREELERLLDEMGLEADVLSDSAQEPVRAEDLAAYELVIVDSGGWDTLGSRELYAAVADVAADGRGLLFLGDDTFLAADSFRAGGAGDAWYAATGMARFVDNGVYPIHIAPAADHPLVNGPWGAFVGFDYAKEPDRAVLADGVAAVTYRYGGETWPVVVAREGAGRVVVADVSVYSSDVCPLGDEAGTASLAHLIQNAVDWLLAP